MTPLRCQTIEDINLAGSAIVSLRSGVLRSFRPFPWQRTSAAGAKVMSSQRRPRPAARGDRAPGAAVDRRQPGAAALVPAGPLFPAFERRARCAACVALARCRPPDDALRDLCRAGSPALRAPRQRRPDRRLGPHRHRSSGHDHPSARRMSGAGGGAVHRQPAGFAGRAQILRSTGQTTCGDGRSACQRGRGDGHPRHPGRGADQRPRPRAAGGPSRDARICAGRGLPAIDP